MSSGNTERQNCCLEGCGTLLPKANVNHWQWQMLSLS